MAKDIHAITQRSGDDHFVLLFDDRNRQEIIDQIEAWTIDPDSPLTTEQATRMIRAIRAAPRFEPNEAIEPLRGGLGALDAPLI